MARNPPYAGMHTPGNDRRVGDCPPYPRPDIGEAKPYNFASVALEDWPDLQRFVWALMAGVVEFVEPNAAGFPSQFCRVMGGRDA